MINESLLQEARGALEALIKQLEVGNKENCELREKIEKLTAQLAAAIGWRTTFAATCDELDAANAKAVAEEREACAKRAEEAYICHSGCDCMSCNTMRDLIKEIRARGEAPKPKTRKVVTFKFAEHRFAKDGEWVADDGGFSRAFGPTNYEYDVYERIETEEPV